MLIVIERKRKEVEGGWSKKRGHTMVAPREAGTHIIVSVSLLKHLWGQFLLNREEGRCQTCNKKRNLFMVYPKYLEATECLQTNNKEKNKSKRNERMQNILCMKCNIFHIIMTIIFFMCCVVYNIIDK